MPILREHFERVRQTLLAKADGVQLAKHKTLRGTARELIVTDFLDANLPSACDYVTGEIIDAADGRSGPLDVIIVPSTAPRFALAGHSAIVLADATIAAMEVKSNLTTSGPDKDSALTEAMNATTQIKARKISCDTWPWTSRRARDGTPLRLPNIPVSIVAFDGPELPALMRHLHAWEARLGSADMMPNTITVLRRDYTLLMNDGWSLVPKHVPPTESLYAYVQQPGASVADLFFFLMQVMQAWLHHHPATPLGSYLP